MEEFHQTKEKVSKSQVWGEKKAIKNQTNSPWPTSWEIKMEPCVEGFQCGAAEAWSLSEGVTGEHCCTIHAVPHFFIAGWGTLSQRDSLSPRP